MRSTLSADFSDSFSDFSGTSDTAASVAVRGPGEKHFQYSTDESTWQDAGTLAEGLPLFTASDLQPETTYYFRAYSTSGGVNSDWSNVVQTSTLAARLTNFSWSSDVPPADVSTPPGDPINLDTGKALYTGSNIDVSYDETEWYEDTSNPGPEIITPISLGRVDWGNHPTGFDNDIPDFQFGGDQLTGQGTESTRLWDGDPTGYTDNNVSITVSAPDSVYLSATDTTSVATGATATVATLHRSAADPWDLAVHLYDSYDPNNSAGENGGSMTVVIPAGQTSMNVPVPGPDFGNNGGVSVPASLAILADPHYTISSSDPVNYTVTNPNVQVGLVAHRTGLNFGETVTTDTSDPSNYLILTNNNYDMGGSQPDYDQPTALVPQDEGELQEGENSTTSVGGAADPGLAEIDLPNLVSGMGASLPDTGTISLTLSDPSAVRLFKSDGTILSSGDLTLDLASPHGYLAGMLNGDPNSPFNGKTQIWVEGLKADPDFSITETYTDPTGHSQSVSVHMDVADWTNIGYDGNPVTSIVSVPEQQLLDLANDVAGATPIPDNAYFKVNVDGVSTSQFPYITEQSGDLPSDSYQNDTVATNTGVQTGTWSVYYTSDGVDPLTDTQKQLILENLGVNAIHDDNAADDKGPTGSGANPATQPVAQPGPQPVEPILEEGYSEELGSKSLGPNINDTTHGTVLTNLKVQQTKTGDLLGEITIKKGPAWVAETAYTLLGVAEGSAIDSEGDVDHDSAQAVVVWKASNGNWYGTTNALFPGGAIILKSVHGERPVKLSAPHAKWDWVDGRDAVFTNFAVPAGAVAFRVLLIYTDVVTGHPDAPAIIGSWEGTYVKNTWSMSADTWDIGRGYKAKMLAYTDQDPAEVNFLINFLSSETHGIFKLIRRYPTNMFPYDTGYDIWPPEIPDYPYGPPIYG